MIRSLLIIVAVILVIIAGFLGYRYFFVTPADTTASIAPRVDLPGADIIAQLSRLPMDFDDTIFSNINFRRLVDGTVQLSPIPAGRPNPFAPLTGLRTTPRIKATR